MNLRRDWLPGLLLLSLLGCQETKLADDEPIGAAPIDALAFTNGNHLFFDENGMSLRNNALELIDDDFDAAPALASPGLTSPPLMHSDRIRP